MYDLEKLTKEIKEKLDGNLLATKNQTANICRVSEATIDRMRKDGTIHSIKIGNQVMFRVDELARFLYQ